MSRLCSVLITLMFFYVSGCAYKDVKHGVYDALNERQCIKDTGVPHCDPERMEYDEYKRERVKLDKD